MKALLFALTCIFLTSCAKFEDGTSVWAEGTWIIPLLTFGGAVIFGYSGYKSSKSGSEQQQGVGFGTKESTDNVKFTSTWQFKFMVALLVATLAIIIYQNSQA